MPEPSASPRTSILPQNIAEDLVFQDELTGLYNRRALELIRRDYWAELTQDGQVSLVIMDLDLFKEVNDAYGHLAGDAVLIATANALRSSFRRDDILLRYGGDEFLVLLPGASDEESETLAERARTALSSQRHFVDDDGDGKGDRPIALPISFSIGRATYPTDGATPRELLAAADARLYVNKRRRRSAASKHWRVAGLLAVVALLLLVSLLVKEASRRQAADLPSVVGPLEPPPTPGLLEDPGGAKALRQEIAELERLVVSLRSALDRGSGPPDAVADTRIAQLEETISNLHDELATSLIDTKVQGLSRLSMDKTNGAPQNEAQSDLDDIEGDPSTTGVATTEGARKPSPTAERQVVVTPPELIRLEPPVYPQKARQLRREATIELEVVVGVDGRVVSVRELGEAAGLGFDAAARGAAMAALYQPGLQDGVAVEMVARLSIQFTLDR